MEAELFGHIAALVQQMGKKEHEQQAKVDIVNSAFKSLKIPVKLQLKIDGYLAFTQSHLESQNEFKSFIDLIPPSIVNEVTQHIFSDILANNIDLSFNPQLIEKLTKRLKICTFTPEDEIVIQGQDGENLYIISKGECIVSVANHLNINKNIWILKTGDIFGEVALIYNWKRTATVKTSNYSMIGLLNKHYFNDLSTQYVGFLNKFKTKAKSYNDVSKNFIKALVKIIPFMKELQ